ncbi:MAG: pyroglutamyl-peptidase I [Proteobacteria bacterium]|nr:pyroglutamyl-peptidase I [Pseudomonadota bacterium]
MTASQSASVLLTGFEPFGGEAVNPAREIVLALAGTTIAGHRVVTAVLPVAFATALHALDAAIAAERPALVIAIGQAGGRAGISIERVAINLIDARIPDNAGAQPIDAPVIAGAPAAYFSTLPVKATLTALHATDIPAELSFSAGSYVCNAVFFALMHVLATRHPSVRGGFIHVPYLPQQAAAYPGAPGMALATMTRGIGIAITAALTHARDVRVHGGAIA